MRSLPILALLISIASPASAQVVDSILPPAVELARFQASIPGPRPVRLAGAPSRDGLVRRFVTAMESRDTTALVALVVDKAEFASLIFPTSEYARPPYRQNPALVWFRMTSTTSKGLGRLLDRDAGRSLGYQGYRCPAKARATVEYRIWEGCTVAVRRDGARVERRLFGSIVEREGRFKFLTYATEY